MNPSLTFLSVRAEAGKTPEIHIRGAIDRKWDSETYSITDTENIVLGALGSIPNGTKAKVFVNSEGGSVKMALGMHNAFKARAKDLTFYNMGLMASAATILPPKGSRVVSPTGSIWMIHGPMSDPGGAVNQEEAEKLAASLGVYGDMMADLYAERAGGKASDWRAAMKATTYMTGKEAIEKGLADDDGSDDDESVEARAEVTAEVMASLNPPAHIKKLLAVASGSGHEAQRPLGSGHSQPATTAPISGAQGGAEQHGGKPATNPKKTHMNKIIAALVASGHAVQADATEDQILAIISPILADNKKLKDENEGLKTKAEAERKTRIEAHVESKVYDKDKNPTGVIKAELKQKWVDAILNDESAQALLDAMPAPQAAAALKNQRGATPPPAEAADAGETVEAKLDAVRAEMRECKDPSKRAQLAIKARELRGHKDLFAKPASK